MSLRCLSVVLVASQPRSLLAGMAHYHAAKWTPPSVAAAAPEGQPCKDGHFPCADDFRDPTQAWGLGGKFTFLASYIVFWLFVALLVHYRHALRRLRKKIASFSTRVHAPASSAGGSPLLEGDVDLEVNEGALEPYPHDKRIVELFQDCAEKAPKSTALVLPGTSVGPGSDTVRREISYGDLAAMIEELASTLNSMGITNGSVVALSLHRSVAQVVAVYGVMKSGAAFLPIDATAPFERKCFVVTECAAPAIIGEIGDDNLATFIAEVGASFIGLPRDGGLNMLDVRASRTLGASATNRLRPESLDKAMIIYTSGTTGTPKGIIYDHQHLMHGAWFFQRQCNMDSSSVSILKSPYFWAVVEWEFFPTLVLGAKLVVASAEGHKSPEYLAKTIAAEKVSVLMITPQVLDLVLDINQAQSGAKLLQSVQHIVTAGEALPCALGNRVAHLRGCNAAVHNFYGASESSCTVYTVPAEGIDLTKFPSKAPAGLPQPHVKVWVMHVEQERDEAPKFRRAPTGEAGEICFGGVTAAGYWKRDELTKKVFVNTSEFGPIYRTGDLGRWNHGQLEVVGRTDRQVKIRGVRVEPEEVEMVLKKLKCSPAGGGTGASTDIESQVLALDKVAVVSSSEPAELVAFVSCRPGAGVVTTEMLKAHCQSELPSSYVPKFFVVKENGLPSLANGKNDIGELKKQANRLVDEEGEVVMDSLGQMKKISQWAIFENAVIHRCYAYWMIGVLTDHYGRCAMESKKDVFFPYCTTFASRSITPWTEAMIRSFGNDQDLFGFILLGAYQDSRPVGGRKRVNLGLKDLFIFAVYLCMALPFAQVMHFVFQQYAWPKLWSDKGAPNNVWDWSYMQQNSYTSDHRWYLIMVLEARIFLAIGEVLRAPGWLQTIIIIIPCCLPSAVFEKGSYAFDGCEDGTSFPIWLQYILSWVFRNWGDGCAVFWRWVHWYTAFYVFCFHFLRPIVSKVTTGQLDGKGEKGYLPRGPVWAALSLGASMTLGIIMSLFHYPNNVLENGTGMQWVALEIGVDIVQPCLFALGMTALQVNMAWWGNTTLGCYVFHFYFKDNMSVALQHLAKAMHWDPTGIIAFVLVIGVALLFTSILGPFGHYLLLSPQFAVSRIRSMLKRSSARSVQAAVTRAESQEVAGSSVAVREEKGHNGDSPQGS